LEVPKLYYYQFRSGSQIAALYSYDLSTGTSGTWTQEWQKTSEDSPLINSNAGILGVDVNGEPVILHHTGGGDYNFARTDDIDGGGTHTQLTPNWSFTGAHFPRNGDWDYNPTNDRLYHLSGDQLVMWTHDDYAYPGGSFLTSTPNGELPLASQSTLLYSLKNDLGWANSGTGTSLWGNSVTAVNGDLYLLRGETSTDGWPFNEGRGLINNRNFAKVGANGWLETLPDVPFNIGKGSGAVYLNGYLYVTQGDTLTVSDDYGYGNVGPLNNEGIRSPGSGFARFAITNNPGTTYTVTNTDDDGEGSLRWAITESNNNPGTDTILFNIGEGGYYTITPLSTLPEITSPVIIDGTSQPGYAGTPIIQISGYQAGEGLSGLVISAGDSTVRGLIITQFSGYGISLIAQGNNTIQGNYIGNVEYIYEGFSGNGEGGILIESGNNLIGGATTSERNIVSGNTGTGVLINNETAINNQVINNYIGLDSSGTSSRPNGVGVGIVNGSDNLIQENVIAGNTNTGVSVLSYGAIANNNQILSNWIGTNQDYNFLGNGDDGIDLAGAKNTLVQGNYIYYNQSTGVVLRGADTTGNQITNNYLFNNAEGMSIQEQAQGNSITVNTISYNNSNGISIDNSDKNTIQGNSIYENNGLGIDLGRDGVTTNDEGDSDTGANALQNYPIFTSAEVVGGTATLIGYLNSEANKEYRIEIFANRTQDASGNGEGEDYRTYITVTTDDNGHADFTLSLSNAERLYSYITGTATNPDGNTSEFSPSITLTGELPNLVITDATAPSSVGLGQSFTVNWTVKNQGTVPTAWSYWSDSIVYSSDDIWGNGNDYYLNNFWVDSSNSNVPLDPDETYTMTGNVTLPSYIPATASGYLLLKTDQYNYQAETDETDNDYSIPIAITRISHKLRKEPNLEVKS